MGHKSLLDIADEVVRARSFVVAVQVAAESLPDERMMNMFADLGGLIEDRLDEVIAALQAHIGTSLEGED